MYRPTITRGFGALTPEVWARIAKAVLWVERNGGDVSSAVERTTKQPSQTPIGRVQEFILARITEVTALSGSGDGAYQWKYAWEKVGVVGGSGGAAATGEGSADVGSVASTDAGNDWAINLCELGNSSGERSGYAFTGDSITDSDGYRIQKVRVGTIVQLFSTRHSTGTNRLQWFFYYQNVVDGECPA